MPSEPITRLNAALEGRYRIESKLGEGGMATVYLADDLKHERKVALKVLKAELAAVVGAERFLAEIKTTANLQHPHILALHDSGDADGMLFYVMPYVEGESLRDRLDREHQLQVEEAVEVAKNVAEALQYAHQRGIIHRDIKPANILVQSGKPLVSDFGIALAISAGVGHRLTETGLSLGTPHYMSPEQATGDQYVGPATDTYALACVLYEMLVGEPPFTGSTPQAILGKIIAGDAPSARSARPSVPDNVDATVARGLERLPADRFASAHDFASALSTPHFRHNTKTETRPATNRQAIRGRSMRSRYAGGLVVAFAAGVAVTMFAVGFGRTPEGPVGPYCVWYDPAVETGGKQVSCDLREALVTDLLAEFGDSLGQGFVVGPNVSGSINASVPRQDWATALSALIGSYGWLAEEDASGNIVVSTIETVNAREAIEPLLLSLHQIRHRDGRGLTDIVGPMLTTRGQVTVDTLTNTLAVQDIERVSGAVAALLQELDRPPQTDTIG